MPHIPHFHDSIICIPLYRASTSFEPLTDEEGVELSCVDRFSLCDVHCHNNAKLPFEPKVCMLHPHMSHEGASNDVKVSRPDLKLFNSLPFWLVGLGFIRVGLGLICLFFPFLRLPRIFLVLLPSPWRLALPLCNHYNNFRLDKSLERGWWEW